jgi:hypothetical protein
MPTGRSGGYERPSHVIETLKDGRDNGCPELRFGEGGFWADGGAGRALRWSMQFDSYLPMAGRESTYFFLWQLSRLMEGKFRRRDDWVLRAGVCLTAGAPGWDVAWFGMVGGVAAAEDHGLYTASRNGPRSRLGMVFKGREVLRQRGQSWSTQRYSAVREPKSRQLARVSKADKQGERVSNGGPASGTGMRGFSVGSLGRGGVEATNDTAGLRIEVGLCVVRRAAQRKWAAAG